ncbi:hypothetical protein EYZ11_000355 [Aspergillus tanneri]|uniref:Uncharacterized protein n=1 Tax=Aspergillus tanneri TaxID=1220188 RepID=A0A4S3JXR7_9EURO|nr:hypothetical protein EYZ11_000355 [Aspergillus tanneri]
MRLQKVNNQSSQIPGPHGTRVVLHPCNPILLPEEQLLQCGCYVRGGAPEGA